MACVVREADAVVAHGDCHRFDGRVVVVTGGASGIGAACARRFAAEGASVVVADIDGERGEAVAREIGGAFVNCDVADADAWQALRESVVDHFGRLDVLHSNAFLQIGNYSVAGTLAGVPYPRAWNGSAGFMTACV